MRRWEQYRTPEHLADALAILRDPGGSAAIVAGGTDLLLDLQQDRHPAVKTLVDVSRVREMLEITERAGWIEVGAAVPLNEIIRHPLVQANADCLVEASELIGGPQVRNVATLGGNVAHALPAGDGTIALLALGAEALLAGMEGTRWQPLESLFDSPGKTTFDRSREILVGFRFPAKRPEEASAFQRVMRPQGVAIAILNMAARIRFATDHTVLQASVAIGPAGPRPLKARAAEAALHGQKLDESTLEETLAALLSEVELRTSPHRATAEYRRHLLHGLLRRTLLGAERRLNRQPDHGSKTSSFDRKSPPIPSSAPASASELPLNVNGRLHRLTVGQSEMLSDVLRYRLRLTGTKIACEEAECGTCTVLLDGAPVLSCVLPAFKAAGRSIVTIEGLASDGSLHPLQEAFVSYGAVQCGFCIPGQLMTAAALLSNNPDPTEHEIRHALKDTLCRCAGYPTIIRSVQAAARKLNRAEPIGSPDLPTSAQTRVVGQLVPRPDAVDKVTGKALFADDYTFPDLLHGATLRAGVPHAIVRRLDVTRARALAGVVAVLTAADIPGEHNHGLVIKDWPALVGVGERVRYVGDAVAVVAAETRELAQQALGLIEVEFDLQPVVSDPVQARSADAPQLHANGNLLKHIKVRKGDLEAGWTESEVVLEETYHTPITEHAFLEPECSLARLTPEGRIEVVVGSQIPYADRSQIARCLGIADDQVRVVGALIGGGFGGKEDIAGQIHAALLAKATGRPVKILYDRHESMLVHPKRHATQIRVKLGAKRDGTLVAAETELYGDTGAYASLGEKVMTRATTHSAGPYVVPHVRADCYAMYTNNPPAGAFRGFGVTQSAFAVESAMDQLAARLGLDPIELRLKNALRVGAITNTGQLLRESVGLTECIERVRAKLFEFSSGADPFAAVPVEGLPSRRRAWGFAAGYKNTGLGGGAPDKAAAEIELYEDETAEVRSSSAEIGQGLVAVLQMIAAEELSLPLSQIRVLLSDTDLTPDGGPTTASRQTYVTGNAVRLAADALKQAIAATLAERYDTPPDRIEFHEGLAQANGHQVSLGEAVGMMKEEGRQARALYEYWAPATQPLGTGGDMHFAYSFAAQAAQVEVDLETGEVSVLRVVAAHDVGKVINPLGFLGQVEGGVMMGLGNALTEHFIVEEGRIFTDRLARYRMPGILHTPEIISIPVEHPAADGPYGAKGVGEISSIPTTPAITNAIYNACGVRIRRLPVDQDWLARELTAC